MVTRDSGLPVHPMQSLHGRYAIHKIDKDGFLVEPKITWSKRVDAEAAARKARATHVYRIEESRPSLLVTRERVQDLLEEIRDEWQVSADDCPLSFEDEQLDALCRSIWMRMARLKMVNSRCWRPTQVRRVPGC